MAQHYKIESWSNEKWYPKIMKRIKWILKYTSGNRSYYGSDYYLKRLSILPKEYCTDVFGNNEGNLALSYKTTINDILDKDNDYPLSDCNIEIHSQSRGLTQNKYIQAYIVL
jgi:hypothetical protein|tara:strand:- start:858 stop:1193 length:336 start_codon:yes stop_codon:yes gene_type:complete